MDHPANSGGRIPSVPPPKDRYPEVLAQALEQLGTTGHRAARRALRSIEQQRTTVAQRRNVPRVVQGEVFRRDGFRCRYCSAAVIPTPVFELLGAVFDAQFPYHQNWKGGETHPAVLSRAGVIDHLHAGSQGGSWRDPANLVTACWPCNARKGDLSLERLGWKLLDPPDDDRDGLTRFYPLLWKTAGQPKERIHRTWMRAFGVTD